MGIGKEQTENRSGGSSGSGGGNGPCVVSDVHKNDNEEGVVL